MGKVKTAQNTEKTPFEVMLGKISLGEYREFVRHCAAKNRDFRTEVEV